MLSCILNTELLDGKVWLSVHNSGQAMAGLLVGHNLGSIAQWKTHLYEYLFYFRLFLSNSLK